MAQIPPPSVAVRLPLMWVRRCADSGSNSLHFLLLLLLKGPEENAVEAYPGVSGAAPRPTPKDFSISERSKSKQVNGTDSRASAPPTAPETLEPSIVARADLGLMPLPRA